MNRFTGEGIEAKTEREQYVAKVQDDLQFLFDERGVDADVQAAISYLGYRTLNRFALVGTTVQEIMEFCRADVGILRSPTGRSMCSAVADCWEAAQKRKKARDELDAEASAGKVPRSSMDGDHVLLRRALYKHWYDDVPLKMSEVPAPVWIDQMLVEVERGEVIAESLDMCLSLADSAEGGQTSTTSPSRITSQGRRRYGNW